MKSGEMFNKRLGREQGTTLVEALITVLLFTMLFGAAVAVLLSGSDSWQVNSVMAELQQERRKAVEWMKMDLQQGGYSTITNVPADGAWYTTITFYTSNGVSSGNISWSSNTVNFALSGSPNYQLIRTSGASSRVIATDIHTLQFRRLDEDDDNDGVLDAGEDDNSNGILDVRPSVVEVSITAQKNTLKGQTLTSSTTFEVKMRN